MSHNEQETRFFLIDPVLRENEFEKYRIVQDRLFESYFDRLIKQIGVGGSQADIDEE